MVRKIKAKAVLRLDGQGLSGRAIARSLGIAGQSVSRTPGAAKTAGVGWDDVADRPDDEVYALLFPGRGERESVYVFLVKLVFRFGGGDVLLDSGCPCSSIMPRARAGVFGG